MTPLPELTDGQMKQFWLIHNWQVACQKGDFERADKIYEAFQRLLKIEVFE